MKREVYYKELPEGYVEVKSIDAKSAKVGLLLTLFSLILTVGVWVIACLIKFPNGIEEIENILFSGEIKAIIIPLVFIVVIFAYLVAHELTHGLVYKIETKEKLVFGMSWSCAYCGVPTLYIGRIPALFAVLAPFVIYTIAFVLLSIFLQSVYGFLAIILFGIHFGGCVGDLYVAILLLFKYKGDVYINDNGPKQVFYMKK